MPGDFGKKENVSNDCETWLLLAAACCRCSAESCGGYFPAIFCRRGEDGAQCLMQNKTADFECANAAKWKNDLRLTLVAGPSEQRKIESGSRLCVRAAVQGDLSRSAFSFTGTSYVFASHRSTCCPLSNLPWLSE